MEKPFLGFFFSRHRLAAQSEGSAHPVELTDADREIEALREEALQRRTRDKGMALAMFLYKGEGFPTQFDRVTMPSIGQGFLSFALHTFEQAIDRRSMHRNHAANPGNRGCCSLLHLSDNLTPGCLALV